MSLLELIDGPEDLHKLTAAQLESLAEEIRSQIIEVVTGNGGHLAPNLGVVELTLALHSVLSSPKDKIIWDVGHQSYVHKLVTGRREQFHTIRRLGGLSGYPRMSESAHDAFGVGHSSTSISAALGYARARDLLGADYRVVAVIGDGALTGGMAFEALNHAGQLGTDMVVVLNDNNMSIARNVGALSQYLTRLRLDPALQRAKGEVETLLRRIPRFGNTVHKAVGRVKDSLKHLVVPGMFFEELGFTYLGPIDGHDIPLLQRVLREALQLRRPVLVHVVTCKGKGYKPAEQDPARYHGVTNSDARDEEAAAESGRVTFSECFGRAMVQLAEKHDRLVAVTAAMPDGTGLRQFSQRFPERFYDVGIAEQHAVTFAAGLAAGGLQPVVAVYSTFLQRAYDQVLHDVCLQNLPVVFAIDRAGIVGHDGATHQGLFDIGFLRAIPNARIMAPRDGTELQAMLAYALSQQAPFFIRYPKASTEYVERVVREDAIPSCEQLSNGLDIALLAYGPQVQQAKEVAAELRRGGISTSVVAVLSLKPLDREALLEICSRVQMVVTLEEHVLAGGFGSAVLEMLADAGVRTPVHRFGIGDVFVEHGDVEVVRRSLGLDTESIIAEIRNLAVSLRRSRS